MNIYWFDKGFYTCDNPDFELKICWCIDVFFTEGISNDGKILRRLQYGDGVNKNKKDVITFLNKALSFGC